MPRNARNAREMPETFEELEDKHEKKKNETENVKLSITEADYSKVNVSYCRSTKNDHWNLKISSWNVDGLRAWLKKNGANFLVHENPDILCLQETKCDINNIPQKAKFKGYYSFWTSGKRGYAGVALLTREEPINIKYGIGVADYDSEGRLITAEFEEFYIVTSYVPNAGRGLVNLPKRLAWDTAFRKYLKKLDLKKPVILCGDMNVSHKEIDLANPKTNTKHAGFTKEEREGMSKLLAQGFVDTFRHLYPNKSGAYTFWTYMWKARSRNIGWRLDYFIVSKRIISKVSDSVIHSNFFGSDHCPITLLFNK